MPLPPSPREIYEYNPLEEVICQLRFPAILAVSANTPVQFQDRVRGGYPWYEELNDSIPPPSVPFPEEIRQLIASVPFPHNQGLTRYQFLTPDKTRSISLAQDFIAVSEQHYSRWETFREEVQFGERVLNETYSPSFYNRVGLRYFDVLSRRKIGLADTPWSELLTSSFLGILGDIHLADDIEEFQVESLLAIPGIDDARLRVRHGLAREETNDEEVYLIDADFHINQMCEREDVFKILDEFNAWGGHLFRWATSEKLRSALKPTTI